MKTKRFIIAVMDSVGIGALPDAAAYHSSGADTLGHILEKTGIRLPNLEQLGLGNIRSLNGVPPAKAPCAAYGKMASATAGKDTTSGHWEIAGLPLDLPLPTFSGGFPQEWIHRFSAAIGHDVLGNYAASGTQIIQDLGEAHLKSGALIVYTSSDSVFQIAAHEDIYPPEKLYEICRIARELLQGPYGVGRVIARPFVGSAETGFIRTENRRDFSLTPPPHGLLQAVYESGQAVWSIGKIRDIFAGQYIGKSLEAHNNEESMAQLYRALEEAPAGLIFANFVDFDMLYGHRNDVEGYAQALVRFDAGIPDMLNRLQDGDILAITADHGNDPSTPAANHDREYVPLLVVGKSVQPVDLGICSSFADLGQTAAQYLNVGKLPSGRSFLSTLRGGKG